MAAVAVWDHRPSPHELLDARLARGWRPIPTRLQDGDQILGYAACLPEVRSQKSEVRSEDAV